MNIIYYFGGKGNMFNELIKRFPKDENINTYVEPFGGAFSVGLKVIDKYPNVIYNDLEKNVYSLFKTLSDENNFKEFKKLCDLTYYSEDLHKEYKEKLKTETDIIKRAYYFFIVNRTSFNGIGKFATNLSVRRNMSKSVASFLSSIDELEQFHQKLSKVMVTNKDGIELMKKYDDTTTFFYCDPPYEQSTRTKFRYIVDMNESLQKVFLETVLSLKKSKILISGYDCKLYDCLIKNGFTKEHFNVNIMGGNYKSKIKIETVWYNYVS